MIEDIWDAIVDFFSYLFSFEWLGDSWEFLSGIFENIGEFSIGGLVFGIATFFFVYLLRDYMLNPFLRHMGPMEYIFWGAATYIGCAVGGYLVGKRLFDD